MELKNRDDIEFVKVISTRGHFNFCNPSQESVSTHIGVYTEDSNRIRIHISANITTEDIVETTDPVILVGLIDRFMRGILYTTEEEKIKKIKQYLLENRERLRYGNDLREFNLTLKRKQELEKKLQSLQWSIEDYEDEQSKFVKGAWITIDQRRP